MKMNFYSFSLLFSIFIFTLKRVKNKLINSFIQLRIKESRRFGFDFVVIVVFVVITHPPLTP